MKDGRTAVRLTGEIWASVKRLAEAQGRTYCAEIDILLGQALGMYHDSPVIVKAGQDFLWLSPAGYYGKVDRKTYKRFLGGGTPILGDERWDTAFGTLNEAILGLGELVCKQSIHGLIIADADLYCELHTMYK